MNKVAPNNFMIIDDDPVNNHICKKYLEVVFPDADIETFHLPEEGLDHIRLRYADGKKETVLFLDVNMPILTGWDVLDRFALFPDSIKAQFTIYILSSSVAPEDRQKSQENSLVSGFVEKPLTIAGLKKLFSAA